MDTQSCITIRKRAKRRRRNDPRRAGDPSEGGEDFRHENEPAPTHVPAATRSGDRGLRRAPRADPEPSADPGYADRGDPDRHAIRVDSGDAPGRAAAPRARV